MISEGSQAPDFELPNEEGVPVRLSNLLKSGPVIVYFYPKDHTAGCTAQACALRDRFEEVTASNATVVGISADDAASHRAFRADQNLPFSLLTDAGGKVASAYGVGKTLGILPGRATFVIDTEQRVRLAFSSQIRVGEHVRRALSAL